MNETRRDFLKSASIGLGAVTALGVGAAEAEACWFKKSQPVSTTTQTVETGKSVPPSSGPEILITSITSGWQIGHSFTVYGTWDLSAKKLSAPQSIECFLRYSNDSPLATGTTSFSGTGSGDWVSDFTVEAASPSTATGLKIVAVMTVDGSTPPLTAQIVDLELLAANGEPITIIEPMPLKAAKEFVEKPKGGLDDSSFDVSAVTSVYIESGTGKKIGGKKIGKFKKTHHKLGAMEWEHKSDLPTIASGTKGSLVVTATHIPKKGPEVIRTFTRSLQGIMQS
jgi:hypothetical protein